MSILDAYGGTFTEISVPKNYDKKVGAKYAYCGYGGSLKNLDERFLERMAMLDKLLEDVKKACDMVIER